MVLSSGEAPYPLNGLREEDIFVQVVLNNLCGICSLLLRYAISKAHELDNCGRLSSIQLLLNMLN